MKVLKGAALIATWEARAVDQLGAPFRVPTMARTHPLAFNRLPPCSLTQPTVYVHNPDSIVAPDLRSSRDRSDDGAPGVAAKGRTPEIDLPEARQDAAPGNPPGHAGKILIIGGSKDGFQEAGREPNVARAVEGPLQ